jgi:hypothetical protein
MRSKNIFVFHMIIFSLLIYGVIYLTMDEASMCPDGMFYNKGYKECHYCHPSCSACFRTANLCINCAEGSFLYRGKCYAKCPDNLIENNKLRRCLRCPEDLYFMEETNECLKMCPLGYQVSNISNSCEKCDHNSNGACKDANSHTEL